MPIARGNNIGITLYGGTAHSGLAGTPAPVAVTRSSHPLIMSHLYTSRLNIRSPSPQFLSHPPFHIDLLKNTASGGYFSLSKQPGEHKGKRLTPGSPYEAVGSFSKGL